MNVRCVVFASLSHRRASGAARTSQTSDTVLVSSLARLVAAPACVRVLSAFLGGSSTPDSTVLFFSFRIFGGHSLSLCVKCTIVAITHSVCALQNPRTAKFSHPANWANSRKSEIFVSVRLEAISFRISAGVIGRRNAKVAAKKCTQPHRITYVRKAEKRKSDKNKIDKNTETRSQPYTYRVEAAVFFLYIADLCFLRVAFGRRPSKAK